MVAGQTEAREGEEAAAPSGGSTKLRTSMSTMPSCLGESLGIDQASAEAIFPIWEVEAVLGPCVSGRSNQVQMTGAR